jgi:type VI secretion system protein ImpA
MEDVRKNDGVASLIDITTLLDRVTEDQPCGPDLEYDAEFIALEQAARRTPEQQYGETTVAATEPNWSDVVERALALMQRTKDVRVAILLTRGLIYLEDAGGLAAGLALVHGLMDRYWDTVHPRLDPDDGLDPTMRLNALMPFADPDTLLRDVRNMYLVRPGRYSGIAVRNVLVAMGKLPATADESAPGRAEIEGIVRAAATDGAAPAEALHSAKKSLDALRALLTDKVGAERVPDFKSLQDVLDLSLQVCDTAPGLPAETEDESVQTNTGIADQQARTLSTEIRSREDAVRVLQRVVEFIERTEPANPAPLFIRRAQRLMAKSFVEIIQELAPESMSQIEKMAGLEGD